MSTRDEWDHWLALTGQTDREHQWQNEEVAVTEPVMGREELTAAIEGRNHRWVMEGGDAMLRGRDATEGLWAGVHQCANIGDRWAVDVQLPAVGRSVQRLQGDADDPRTALGMAEEAFDRIATAIVGVVHGG